MQGTKVIFGTYNTMPDGASGKLYELTYQRCWRPFLSSLYKFTNVYSVLYYSGIVFQWIEENHPEFILLLEEMADRKQIELLGGGYFNPLFPALQSSDKIGQIEMLTTYLRKTFGKRPSGGWLYEYAWDASLPLVFRNSGLGYTFLPAEMLQQAGVFDAGIETLVTEDQKKLLYVLPSFDLNETFGSAIPFESALEALRGRYPDASLFPIFVDGHSTHAMWENSGLESPDVMFEKTFAWFQKNCLEVETLTAQTFVKSIRGGKLFYLAASASSRFHGSVADLDLRSSPHLSCMMTRQAILANRASKRLYDKMLHVHTLMTLLRGDKARKKSAQEDLWRSQDGEAYWEGPLGGIRRPEVRMNAYRALLEAEKATRIHGSFSPGIILDDIDCDGEREVVYQAAELNCYIHGLGAAAFEIDSVKGKQNFCCTYDRGKAHENRCFVDHIYESGDFASELVSLGAMRYSIAEKDHGPQKISFTREFLLHSESGASQIILRKSYLFQKYSMSVDLELSNRSGRQLSFRLGTELNLQLASSLEELEFFLGLGHEKRRLESEILSGEYRGDTLSVKQQAGKDLLELRSDKAFAVTISHLIDMLSNDPAPSTADMSFGSGELPNQADRLYQGTRFIFGWDLQLAPDSTVTHSITLHMHP
jgi:alpha-amylase